jgi:hypothetical protein
MEAKGSLADPLSDRDIEAKLRDCARLGGTDWDSDRIIDGVWRLDTLADIASLMGGSDEPRLVRQFSNNERNQR